jgi:autophagy-related protein 27
MCVHLHDFFTESPDKRLPAPKFISIFLNGPDYPSPTTSLSKPQSVNLTIICHPLETSDPKFVSYDGSKLDVEWTGSAGCPFEEEGGNNDDKKDDKKEDKSPDHESIGSGLGWFSLAYVIYSNFESFHRLKFYLK